MKPPMLIVLVVGSLGVSLAQAGGAAGTDSINPWLKATVTMAALSALIWVVQHLLRHTIPEREKAAQETLDKIHERSETHDTRFLAAMDKHTENCQQIQQRWADQPREK